MPSRQEMEAILDETDDLKDDGWDEYQLGVRRDPHSLSGDGSLVAEEPEGREIEPGLRRDYEEAAQLAALDLSGPYSAGVESEDERRCRSSTARRGSPAGDQKRKPTEVSVSVLSLRYPSGWTTTRLSKPQVSAGQLRHRNSSRFNNCPGWGSGCGS